jgi:iron complex outermembrane receptor protein
MSSATFKGLSGLILTTSILAISAPAMAQLDEIVVTATKTEKSLQDVSASIVAFDVEALERNRIEGLEDIAQFTPGLYSYPSAANSNGLRISLRGVGTFDPQLGLDSKVAIYTDGVYMGKTVGLAFDSPDLARVEVLKGPQGTLYGRNAVAGAINLISQAPDTTRTFGRVEGEAGNLGALGFKGVLNVAMSDNAALRVSGQYDKREGWVKNSGAGNDFAGYDRFGARAAMAIDVSPEFSFELAGDYNKSTNEPYFYQSFDINTPTSLFANAVVGATNERLDEISTFGENGDGFTENTGVSLTTNWDFHENHSMKTVLSWRGLDSERYVALNPMVNPQIVEGILNADLDQNPLNGVFSINTAVLSIPTVLGYTPGPQARPDYFNFIPRSPITGLFQSPDGTRSPTVDGHSQISFETTSTGSFNDGRLEYTAGVYYFDEDTSTGVSDFNGGDAQDYLDVLGPAFGLVPGALACNFAALGFAPLGSCTLGGNAAPDAGTATFFRNTYSNLLRGALIEGRFSTGNQLSINTEAYAAYGQATFHVNDDMRLIGGVRYSKENKEGTQLNASPFFRDQMTFVGTPILPQSGETSFDSFDPQAIIEYDASDDVMVYASFSQAFRSGGFNASASLVPVAPDTTGADFIFDPEEITAYEVGFKGEFNNRIRLNAAGFYYQLKNEQRTVAIDPLISTKRAIANTASDIWGIEADLTASLTDEITFNGSVSWVDGDPDDVVNPVTQQVITREQLQATPELSYTASLNYEGQLNNGADVFGNISYSHADSVETTPSLFLTSRNLVNGRIGVRSELNDGRVVSVSLWGQNLFDDEYTVDALPFETFVKQVHVFGTPRTYGVSVGMDF